MTGQSPWARRITRLKSMSAQELFDRTRQHLTARLDAWRYRRGHDFAGDVANNPARHGRFFFAPAETLGLCQVLRERFPVQARNIVAWAERICRHQFDLLGFEDLDYGTEIDWHLDIVHGKRGAREPWFKVNYLDFETVGDSKITWELNRHQHLVTLAKAYRLTGDCKYADEIVAQWKHWHAENPYPIGMNWASSLEVAFRSLSWVWVYFLLAESAAMTAELRREWVRGLAISGRHIETYLSTYFSPNTHLLGEGVALFFLGVLFPDLQRAQRWQQRGWKIVLESVDKQVRADGFYFERSTYYHVYALDLFLHARILAAVNEVPIPAPFDEAIVRMLDALCLLSRGGVPPTMGDDDGGRLFDPRRNRAEHLLDPLSTGSVLFAGGDFRFLSGPMREETLWLLGASGLREFEGIKSSAPSSDSAALRDSGLYLMADAETGQQLTIDAGPQGPGHGHADTLHLSLIRNGRALLIDPGTYEYVGDHGERARYRGTSAHNTLCVDSLDQADGAGPFAWRNSPVVRVERWIAGQQFNLFSGSHGGYKRLAEPVSHQRWVFHRKGQFWLVRDVADGQGNHRLELTWHLGPSLSPVSTRDNLFADGQESLGLMTTETHGWSQSAHRGNWSPVYGRAERATVLTFGREAELPVEFVTLLLPDATLQGGIGRLDRLLSGASVCVYRYIREGQEHQFFFANGNGPWNFDNWGSDAPFVYWSWEREREQRVLIACGGSYVEIAGLRVLTSDRVVDYAEVVSSGAKPELFSSDLEHVVLQASLDPMDRETAVPGNDPKRAGV
jgi:Heparinase II/III-like protein/Heparinase II/III N-terminus